MINIIVNGEVTPYRGEPNVEAMLSELGLPPGRVAVMLNDEVVTRDLRAQTALKENDRLEILTFAGGG